MSPNDSVPRPGVKYLAHIVFSILIFEKSPHRFSYSAISLSNVLLYPSLPALPASGDHHSLYLKVENSILTLKRSVAVVVCRSVPCSSVSHTVPSCIVFVQCF